MNFKRKQKKKLVMNWIVVFSLLVLCLFLWPSTANAEVCVKDGEQHKICKDDWESLAQHLSMRLDSWRSRGIRAIKKIDALQAEIKKKDAIISENEKRLSASNSYCEHRLITERIKFGKVIGMRCKPPTEMYVIIVGLSLAVIGGSVGFYFLGKSNR